MTKYIFGFLLLFSLVGAHAQETSIKIGEIPPKFNFTLLNPISVDTLQLEELKDQVVILDFWATWCSPCAKALPKLNEMYNKYQDKGVQFLGINIDSQKNDAKIKPFVKTYQILYPVLKDPNSQLASRLNVTNIPTLLIVNSENEVVYRHQGYRFGDEKIIEEEILKILGEPMNE